MSKPSNRYNLNLKVCVNEAMEEMEQEQEQHEYDPEEYDYFDLGDDMEYDIYDPSNRRPVVGIITSEAVEEYERTHEDEAWGDKGMWGFCVHTLIEQRINCDFTPWAYNPKTGMIHAILNNGEICPQGYDTWEVRNTANFMGPGRTLFNEEGKLWFGRDWREDMSKEEQDITYL